MFGQVSLWHILIVLAVAILVFGSKRLPDTARALGKSMRILKSETAAMKNDGAAGPDAAGKDAAAKDGADGQTASRTIQAAPGDVASARPVDEPKPTTHG